MTQVKHHSDVDRLCSLLFLQDPICQKSTNVFCATVAIVIDAPMINVADAIERLSDKSREDYNVELFSKFDNGELGADHLDFKVMLCTAFATGINLKKLVGSYHMDILKVVADMSSERVDEAIAEAKRRGLIEIPSKGQA